MRTLVTMVVIVSGCAAIDVPPDLGATASALTADECDQYEVNGKVQICHATGSETHPFVILRLSENACVNAHADHEGDYVAVNDPTCQSAGCLPLGAPCASGGTPCCGNSEPGAPVKCCAFGGSTTCFATGANFECPGL